MCRETRQRAVWSVNVRTTHRNGRRWCIRWGAVTPPALRNSCSPRTVCRSDRAGLRATAAIRGVRIRSGWRRRSSGRTCGVREWAAHPTGRPDCGGVSPIRGWRATGVAVFPRWLLLSFSIPRRRLQTIIESIFNFCLWHYFIVFSSFHIINIIIVT